MELSPPKPLDQSHLSWECPWRHFWALVPMSSVRRIFFSAAKKKFRWQKVTFHRRKIDFNELVKMYFLPAKFNFSLANFFFRCTVKNSIYLNLYMSRIADLINIQIISIYSQEFQLSCNLFVSTLESGIDVGPTIINLAFFSRPYNLIKGPTFIIFWNFF